jgi:hypothetical protein
MAIASDCVITIESESKELIIELVAQLKRINDFMASIDREDLMVMINNHIKLPDDVRH